MSAEPATKPAVPDTPTGDQDVLPDWLPAATTPPTAGVNGWRFSASFGCLVRTVAAAPEEDEHKVATEFDPFATPGDRR